MESLFWTVLILLSCETLIQATSVDQCIDRIIDFSLLDYRARRIGTRLDDEIRILSDIQFTCSTIINSVILGIDVRPNRDSFPSVQLWRPTGNSNYDFVPGSERFIFYTTENVSRTGVYDYPLEPPLEVKTGDRLAFSQPEDMKSGVRGYYIDNVNFNSHSINFGDTTADLSGSPINNDLVLVYPILTDKQCVHSTSSVNATFIKDKSLLISDSRRRQRRQLLYPELRFSCNGSVTKWIYGAVDRLDHPQDTELPEIQIWRQTDTDTYTKQTFSRVSANETEPETNIHEYYPETPLEFQEGDILGYFQPRESDSQIVLYAQRESGPTNLRVDGNVDIAPIAVTISKLREEGENHYPLISLEISIISEQLITSTFNVVPSSTQSVTDETISSTLIVTDETISKVSMISSPESTSSSLLSTNTKLTSSSTGKTSKPNSADSEVVTSSAFSPAETDTPESGQVGIAIGISIAIIVLLFIIVIIILAVFLLIKRKANRKQDGAFNNPIYHTPISINTSKHLNNHLYEAQDVKLDLRSTDTSVNNYPGIYDEAVPTEKGITTEVFYCEAGMPLPNKDINKNVIQDVGDGISMDAFTNINYGLPTDTSAHIYNVLDRGYPTQWGVLVPTIDQRNKIGSVSDPQDSVYASLQEVQSTDLLPQENITFFIEEPIYWEPAVDKSAIYHQLSQKKYREIVYQQIEVTGDLGSGEFGSVYKGRWHSPGGPINVAIKSLKQHSADEDRVRFLQEAAIMGQFHHPNVVKLHGVVTMKEPEMIILELMSNGDLRQYLHQIGPIPGELVDTTVPSTLLSFCCQIASGMEYLSKKHFVHRDLAARNILVADKGICKVADFGMSRDLQNDDYYISNAKKIPIKWTAPEALHYRRYSTSSDVWSFGVVLYEIWSMGHKPFEGHTNQECLRKVVSGYRLPPPPGCPRPMYEMMIQCWHPESSSRPTFIDLVADLSQPDFKLLQTDTDTCLGAHLDTALSLYPELQYIYMS